MHARQSRRTAKDKYEEARGKWIKCAAVADAWLTRHSPNFGDDVMAGRAIWLVDEKDPVNTGRARPSPRHSLSLLQR
jgi:hypothetical protein